jgi:ribosomal protein S12 methylthiotransferase accessory factor
MTRTIPLQDTYKTYTSYQDKARAPQETVAHVRERLAELEPDILQKTMRIDTGRLDIPVYLSLCGTDAMRVTGTKKFMGKGGTSIQAEASALMELVERYSLFCFIQNTAFPVTTLAETGDAALAMELLQLALHDRDTDLERAAPVLSSLPFRWVPASNLTRNTDVLLPIDWFYTINEYNGPAAGNVLEEAVLQGLCEVVERHVSSVISHDRLVTSSIDPASVQDSAARELLGKFAASGVELYIKDFSLDTGIPTVGVLAWDPRTFPDRSEIVFTAGTATHPEKSLIRALTEVAQLAGDFENRTSYRPTLPKYESLEEADYLTSPARAVPISTLPNLSHRNFNIEIQRCVAALAGLGLEVLVVDVTHPELGIPTVYTIVPGAHFLDRTRDTSVPFHAAKILSRTLDAPRALDGIGRLMEVFPGRYDLHFFLGLTLEYQERPADALVQFRQALKLDPRSLDIASIHTHIGVCLKDLEDYPGAIEALRQARDLDPDLKEVYNLLGFCYFKLGEHERSIRQFERALELDPGSAIDYANIGSNLREMGHKKEAVRLYRMALELDPSIEFARQSLARLEAELEEEGR